MCSGSALVSAGSIHVKGNDRGSSSGGTGSGGLVGTVPGSGTAVPISQGPSVANSSAVHPPTQGNHQVPAPSTGGPPGITSNNSGPPPGSGPASQPVEFNHAINYVNKIKVDITFYSI